MKNNPENEPLLNVIARQVGRAAGTVAKAAKQITGEENTANPAKPTKTRKKAKPAAATKTAKKKAAKSRTRKSQPKSSSRRAKRTS